MLGLFNAIVSLGGAIERYVREGLVMANKFTPAKLTFPSQGSAEFDGASDYIQLDTPFSYTNHTIAAWVYVNNTATNKVAFDNRDGNDDGIAIFLDSSEQIYYLLNTSDLGPFSVTADDWVFVTATYDGTTQKLYIDGSLSGSQAASQTISVSSDSTIGAQNVPKSNYYDGNLANVAIWNRALSSDEINSVMWKSYEQLTTSESSGLQAWYKLEESELLTDSAADLLEYANNLGLEFEGQTCVQNALTAFPTADAGRLLFEPYDVRVVADGGATEARTCTINELNAIL